MSKNAVSVVITMLGVIFAIAGFFLLKNFTDMPSLPYPYVLIGIGCGAFGHGFGNIISNKAIKNHPDLIKMKKIEMNDERNQTISHKAKAKAYDCMIFVYGALILAFALMNVSLPIILLMVFAYLFVSGYGLFYRFKYDKEL